MGAARLARRPGAGPAAPRRLSPPKSAWSGSMVAKKRVRCAGRDAPRRRRTSEPTFSIEGARPRGLALPGTRFLGGILATGALFRGDTRLYARQSQRAERPCATRGPRLPRRRQAVPRWCRPRSSKPVGAPREGLPGEFDSHGLPPCFMSRGKRLAAPSPSVRSPWRYFGGHGGLWYTEHGVGARVAELQFQPDIVSDRLDGSLPRRGSRRWRGPPATPRPRRDALPADVSATRPA